LSDDSSYILPHYHHYNSKRRFLYFHLYSFSLKSLFTVVSHITYERLDKISRPITSSWIYKKLFILCPTPCYILNINVSEIIFFDFTPTTILRIISPLNHHYDQLWEVWTSFKTFYLLFLCVTVGKSTIVYNHLPPIISLNDSPLNFISRNTTIARVSHTPWHQLVKVIQHITSYWRNYSPSSFDSTLFFQHLFFLLLITLSILYTFIFA
jgi:hypothetical protein